MISCKHNLIQKCCFAARRALNSPNELLFPNNIRKWRIGVQEKQYLSPVSKGILGLDSEHVSDLTKYKKTTRDCKCISLKCVKNNNMKFKSVFKFTVFQNVALKFPAILMNSYK